MRKPFSLTCFIRSKSKASIATSLLLLTGFILEKWKRSIKKVSSLQCMLSYSHLTEQMKSTPELDWRLPLVPLGRAWQLESSAASVCTASPSEMLLPPIACVAEGAQRLHWSLIYSYFFFFCWESQSVFQSRKCWDIFRGQNLFNKVLNYSICNLQARCLVSFHSLFSVQQPCLDHLDSDRVVK